MGPPSYMRSVVDRNVVIERMTVIAIDSTIAQNTSPCPLVLLLPPHLLPKHYT